MKSERLAMAIGNIDDELIYAAVHDAPKKKRPAWVKWGAVAACLCLVAVIPAVLRMMEGPSSSDTVTDGLPDTPQESFSEPTGDQGLPASFTANGRTYMISSYLSVTDKLPAGFEEAGVTDVAGFEDRPYYLNPDVPEWAYVLQEVRTNGQIDSTGSLVRTEPHEAYVRYVDIRLRSKDLLRCGDDIYVSMWSVNLYETADVSWEYHDAVDEKYGNRMEGDAPVGFVFAGTAEFSGYDTVPSGALSLNTEAADVYLNEAEPDIALVATHWYTAPLTQGGEEVRHEGFNVYIRYDCPF